MAKEPTNNGRRTTPRSKKGAQAPRSTTKKPLRWVTAMTLEGTVDDGKFDTGWNIRARLGASCTMNFQKNAQSARKKFFYPSCTCKGNGECRARVHFDADKSAWIVAIDKNQIDNLYHDNGAFIIGGKSAADFTD